MLENYYISKMPIKQLRKKINIFIFFLTSLNTYFVVGQNNSLESLYNWFDNEIGKENLDINNGLLFNNEYPIANNSSRFFKSDIFENNNVVYNNQTYFNLYINYDLFEDELLIKPSGKNDRIIITTIRNNVNSFVFDGRKFVNLNYNSIKDDLHKGYYEEILIDKKITLFVKHLKSERKVFINDKVYFEFDINQRFIINYKNNYYNITSKRSIQNIFPKLNSKINEFYSKNGSLQSLNKILFFKNLLSFLKPYLDL